MYEVEKQMAAMIASGFAGVGMGDEEIVSRSTKLAMLISAAVDREEMRADGERFAKNEALRAKRQLPLRAEQPASSQTAATEPETVPEATT